MSELKLVLDELVVEAPLDRASWTDVVGRSRRPRRRRLAGLGIAVAVAIALTATPAFGIGSRLLDLFGGTPVATDQMSTGDLRILSAMTRGARLTPLPGSREGSIAGLGATTVRQIAEREGRAYFVVDTVDGGRCFAVGAIGAADVFGSMTCPQSPVFPSPGRPILDRTVFHGSASGSGACCLYRFEGFAADGVASVGVITAGGVLKAVTPVRDNVYVRTHELPSDPLRAIVALDSQGNRIYNECFMSGGC